jgi:N-acyl-D-aspartate/D-glutamate deacylase
VAAARNQDPFDALLDIVMADDLRTGLRPPARVDTEADWDYRTEVWRDPRAVVGGSDAGAHLDMMCGATYTTSLLAGARIHGRPTIEEAIQLLSDAPARLYGLYDRGRISPGYQADLVILDPQTVGYGPETTRHDLPGGAWRLYTGSVGVEKVYVNGTAVVSGGRLTGATPGHLLRSGRDTHTVTVHDGGFDAV